MVAKGENTIFKRSTLFQYFTHSSLVICFIAQSL